MATAALLAGLIAVATGPGQFPARIGRTAVSLSDQASARFAASTVLLELCLAVNGSTETANSGGASQGFIDEDAEVVAFFLARNTALKELECVEAPGTPSPASLASARAPRQSRTFRVG